MARPSKHDGSIYPRKDGKVLWMVYRDRSGKRIRESTFTEDWQEAQRKLRERLQARDDKILDVVRKEWLWRRTRPDSVGSRSESSTGTQSTNQLTPTKTQPATERDSRPKSAR